MPEDPNMRFEEGDLVVFASISPRSKELTVIEHDGCSFTLSCIPLALMVRIVDWAKSQADGTS